LNKRSFKGFFRNKAENLEIPSASSKLSFRVAKTVDFWEPAQQQGGCHEQEVYRAAHGRGTDDLRSDHQERKGQVREIAAGDGPETVRQTLKKTA
jgi:hypothetical protein